MDATPTPLGAAIYARVSKLNQRSVSDQEHDNREACGLHGWLVSHIYVDDGISASRFARKEREQWPLLLADLESRRVGVLVMWEPSRGDRDLEMWARLLNTCRRLAVLIHITSHHRTYDVRNARDWRSLAEDGVDSAYESEKTRERILRTVARTAAAGRPHGRILYGYRRRYNPHTGVLEAQEIHPEQAAVVREMARRVLAGQTTYAVAGWLNDQGHTTPTGIGWEPVQVKRVLINPGYAGKRVYRGEVFRDATWPAIFDEPTHKMLVAKLTDPTRGSQRDSAIKHLMSGIALCGVCGSPMRVAKNRGSLSYTCWINAKRPASGKESGQGFHVARLVSRVDRFVEELLFDRLSRPDALELFARSAGRVDELRSILDLIAEKRVELDQSYALAREGRLSPMGLASAEAGLLPEIERLERLGGQIRLVPLLGDLISSDAELVAEKWVPLAVTQKREVIRAVMVKVEVLKVGKGRRDYSDWESVRVTWRSGAESTSDTEPNGTDGLSVHSDLS